MILILHFVSFSLSASCGIFTLFFRRLFFLTAISASKALPLRINSMLTTIAKTGSMLSGNLAIPDLPLYRPLSHILNDPVGFCYDPIQSDCLFFHRHFS